MNTQWQAIRQAGETFVAHEDYASFTAKELAEQYKQNPWASQRKSLPSDIVGDIQSLFCDLVSNLVPVEDAKAICGIH